MVEFYRYKRSSQGLTITEKVSFNVASIASYIYILSGQKITKNAKNGQFCRPFENLKLAVKQCYQTGQDKNWWEVLKFNNSNGTFLVIFKHCEVVGFLESLLFGQKLKF